jgi:thioredoxin 1
LADKILAPRRVVPARRSSAADAPSRPHSLGRQGERTLEDERAAAPHSAPFFDPNETVLKSRTPSLRSRQRALPSLGDASASSTSEPARSESQRARALNDHRAHLLEFTDDNFEFEVVQAPLPVIIDFWAETCAPCRLMHPIMRRIAETFVGRASVGRLNVYENPRTTEALEIKAIPYLIVVRQGDILFELVGDRSYEELRSTLEPFLT